MYKKNYNGIIFLDSERIFSYTRLNSFKHRMTQIWFVVIFTW